MERRRSKRPSTPTPLANLPGGGSRPARRRSRPLSRSRSRSLASAAAARGAAGAGATSAGRRTRAPQWRRGEGGRDGGVRNGYAAGRRAPAPPVGSAVTRVLHTLTARSITYVTFSDPDALAAEHDGVLCLEAGGAWNLSADSRRITA